MRHLGSVSGHSGNVTAAADERAAVERTEDHAAAGRRDSSNHGDGTSLYVDAAEGSRAERMQCDTKKEQVQLEDERVANQERLQTLKAKVER